MSAAEKRQIGRVSQGLYVHVPFCETKCGYCDFFSVAVKDRNPSPLVDRVIAELSRRLRQPANQISTIFVGGGTPTILPPADLDRLLAAINAATEGHAVDEFTVEANPATVDPDKAAILRKHGVSRVSVGAQSFLQTELTALERIHCPDDVEPSIRILRDGGIRQINIDLIFGIPGQTAASWMHSLETAIALEPDHLACYGLTYEPGTRLTAQLEHGRVVPCDEHLESELFLLTRDRLEEAGFTQYEISNFAKTEAQCAHNLIYWRNQPYVGVGPSAAGCDTRRRYKNVADIAGYIKQIDTDGLAEVESEILSDDDVLTEMVMMQLRLNEGLSRADLDHRFAHQPEEIFGTTLQGLVEAGLMLAGTTHISLTRKGLLLANSVMAELATAGSEWLCSSYARRAGGTAGG